MTEFSTFTNMRAGERAIDMRAKRAYKRARTGTRKTSAQGVLQDLKLSVLGKGKIDRPLAVVAILLSLLGLVFIYSASCYSAKVQTGDAFRYVKTQAVALAIGVLLSVLLSNVKAQTLKKFSPFLYLVGLALLGAVFLPVVGVESYGAKRWLNLGFFTIQPSEYAKFFMVMAISAYASQRDMSKFANVLFVLFLGGATCVLIMLEPNMSITMCVVGVIFIMLFASGAKVKHLVLLLLPVIAGAVVLIVVEPYRMQRLLAFFGPVEISARRGVSAHTILLCFGKRRIFRSWAFRIEAEIFVFTLCRERFYIVRSR